MSRDATAIVNLFPTEIKFSHRRSRVLGKYIVYCSRKISCLQLRRLSHLFREATRLIVTVAVSSKALYILAPHFSFHLSPVNQNKVRQIWKTRERQHNQPAVLSQSFTKQVAAATLSVFLQKVLKLPSPRVDCFQIKH